MKKFAFAVALSMCACLFLLTVPAFGQIRMPGVAPQQMAPSGRFNLEAARERTPEQMDRYEATSPMSGVHSPEFRPTIPMDQYLRMKAAISQSRGGAKPGFNQPEGPLHGVTGATAFTGGNQNDNGSVGQPGWFPPDAGGAIGASQFVQALNAYINVYSKTGALLSHRSLAAFLGAACNTSVSGDPGCPFDPRVQYDPLWKRFIVTADAFDDGAGHQYFWIAVSKTSSATGAWWVYLLNTYTITGGTGVNFWDYPQLGMDQDGLIFTANVFSNSSGNYLGAWVFSLAKAQVYNGFPQGFVYFSAFANTLSPPMVQARDLNGYAWIAMSYPSSGAVYMLYLQGSSTPDSETMSSYYPVSGVTAYTYPPLAPQTCGSVSSGYGIDTLDARFQMSGTQIGDKTYLAQAVGIGSSTFPFIRYYVISGLYGFAPTVAEQGTFYASNTSYDFNPSIAADSLGELVLTWSATDPAAGLNSEVRYVGKQSADPALSGIVGASLTNNTTCLSGNYQNGIQRWGDYSQVSVDPGTAKTFWVNNEDILGTSEWGTEFGKVHF